MPFERKNRSFPSIPDGDEQQAIQYLRTIWEQAMADNSPGLDPDEVFERLHKKYRARAEAARNKGAKSR